MTNNIYLIIRVNHRGYLFCFLKNLRGWTMYFSSLKYYVYTYDIRSFYQKLLSKTVISHFLPVKSLDLLDKIIIGA